MSRYFIFLRQEINSNCNAYLYWKPLQQGGCFVGKTDTEIQAITHAKKIYQYYSDNYPKEHPERAIDYHIVDIIYHKILLVGSGDGIKYINAEDAKQKKEITNNFNVIDYSNVNVTFKQLGKLDGKD